MEREGDVLGKYRNISNKLKKRFLKKPNVAEGSEQFGSLARSLKTQECPQYAGFCCLAQARCEHTLANAPGEAQALTDAARNFLEAEESLRELQCPSFNEHLNASINCYSHAIRVHVENKQPALAAALSVEVGDALRKMRRSSEAISHYQRAAELQLQNPLDHLTALGNIASCKIDTRDYEGALGVFTEMSYMAQERGNHNNGRPMGVFCDILARCEITRVLLLMLLQPTAQRIRPEHAQTLEKYAWGGPADDSVTGCFSQDLFLLLQSVVMACQSQDLGSLSCLQTELWPLLSTEQNHLLHLVIQELSHPAGEGL